jgi:hypothetical protein
MKTIYCRYCRGARPTQSAICLGCGSDACECSTRRPQYRRRCPKCTDGMLRPVGVGLVVCDTCGFDGVRREL